MGVLRLDGVLRRYWYVAALGLVATAGAAGGVWNATPSTYTASATTMLMPSDDLSSYTGNPFLSIAGLDALNAVVLADLTGDAQRAAIAERFAQVDYTVAVDTTLRGPVLLLSVDGGSAQGTVGALDALLAAFEERVASRQADQGVAPHAKFGWMLLARDDDALPVAASLAPAARVGAGGLVLTAGATVGADLLVRRTRRR